MRGTANSRVVLSPPWAAPAEVAVARPRTARLWRQARRLLVVALLVAAGLVAYRLVAPAFDPAPRAAADGAAAAASDQAEVAQPPRPLHTLRPSAFRLESPAGVLGSAFVAWHGGGRTYLMTSHFAAHGVVADAHGELLVRRGSETWRASAVRRDKLTGFAVLRVERRIGEPLWTTPVRPRLGDGDEVVVVLPPQRDVELVRARIAVAAGVVSMEAPWSPLLLGSPVVTPGGVLAGVVTGIHPVGGVRIAPIGDACQKIRRCPADHDQVEHDGVAHAEWLRWGSREAWLVGVELARELWRSDAEPGEE